MAAQDEKVTTGGDEVGKVEAHGIEYIAPTERHGRPRDLFAVWAASNINYLYVLLGGLLVVFGLTLGQALIAVVVGNLFWAAIGVIAISGPAAGAPSSVITRAMFGTRGNRINVGVFSWPVFIAYEAVNLSIGALAGFAIVQHFGATLSTPLKVVLVASIATVTLVVSVYGHATILRLSGAVTVALALAMGGLAFFVVRHADWSYQPTVEVGGGASWSIWAAGVALIAAAPLSWGVSPDYARYLPQTSSRTAIAAWTGLGGFIPSVALGAVGVLAATVVDMSDAQTSIGQLLPFWFYPIFLAVIVIGSMSNNVLTMYSSGLCLQVIGIPLRRSITVLIDGLLGVALAGYALFVSDFTAALSGILELTVTLLGPSIAIYITDLYLRRNDYSGYELRNDSPDGQFWYTKGFNVAGFAAFALGTGSALLCVNTTDFTGPIAIHLGGADVSWIVGPMVAGVVYAALSRTLYPASTRAATARRSTSGAARKEPVHD
ncbi:MAG: cytosine permease [Rhodococcus sp. (in: high G+C Gram-positive bacteria)]